MTFSPPAARRVLPVMALACVAVLAAGCGPDDDTAGSAPASTSTAGASATSTPGATAPGTSATGGTTTGGAPAGTASPKTTAAGAGGTAVPACATRDLQAKAGSSQGTAGSTYTAIDFKNLSQRACTLYGYPGVSLAGGTPVTAIGLAATQSTAAPRRLVTLAPGATGNATLQIADAGNFSASQCQPANATYLQIYPPNQTTPIYLSYSSPTCAGHVHVLTIGVVVAGAGGS